MRIHTDHNGVYVNAISSIDGTNVEGHLYHVQAGVYATSIEFQRGGVADNGVNGMTNEALLAILIHRTKFLDAKFTCEENKRAIQNMEEAYAHLNLRTIKRLERGVEGKELA